MHLEMTQEDTLYNHFNKKKKQASRLDSVGQFQFEDDSIEKQKQSMIKKSLGDNTELKEVLACQDTLDFEKFTNKEFNKAFERQREFYVKPILMSRNSRRKRFE